MSLRRELAERLSGRVIVMGVGNPMRGDDAAGCLLARALRGRCAAAVIEAEEIPESYLGAVAAAEPDTVVLVDAMDLGAEAGSVAIVESPEIGAYVPSTHRLPLSFVMELIRHRTGADVLLIGLQPATVGLAEGVSPRVAESVESLASLLSELVRDGGERAAAVQAARRAGGVA